ncbi:MAG: CoA-binding protein [Chloroflexi bacterium]|nr:MAG: CoA-binding protein [Chloroflexota bacterium]
MTADDGELAQQLIAEAKTIAVVGANADPTRASNEIAQYLIEAGYEVYLVNPAEVDHEILGRKVYARLQDVPAEIDIVDVFRRPQFISEVVAEAIEAGAKVVWTQLAIVNEEAAETARTAGLDVVMDRCTKIEHARMLRGGV